jgi:hypothetical protein
MMHRRSSALLLCMLAVAMALLASSCFFSTPGVGQGMDYPARWGGGTTGPPVFVGGPSS